MIRFFRFLFPKRRLQQCLRLLSLRYSSDDCPYDDPIDGHTEFMLRGEGLIRSRQDAIRCLRDYPGKPLAHIIQKEKRKRRFQNRLRRAWLRLQRRW